MSSHAAFFWDTLFAIMIVVAIFGNTAVLWIVMRKHPIIHVCKCEIGISDSGYL